MVLVATVRALKLHGGVEQRMLMRPDPGKVAEGLPNLEKHIENIHQFGESPVIALNRFGDDTEEEIDVVRKRCKELGAPFAVSEHHARGGEGAEDLARAVLQHAQKQGEHYKPLYDLDEPVADKILAVARKMYGARDVVFTKDAERDLADLRRLGYNKLPVCIAKTPASLSDDPKLRGRPADFSVTVRNIQINAGAGFLVVLTGDILRMPGLPRKPLSESIDLRDGEITGMA